MTGRKGRRLAVALSPRWPRWGGLLLASVATAAWSAALLGYMYFAGDEFAPHRVWMVVVLNGGILLLCVVFWVKAFVPWLLAGDAAVEISRAPVSPGQEVEYSILQGRDHSSIRRMEATIYCRRTRGRGMLEDVVALPLGAAAIEPGGRRAMIRGTVRIPDGPPSTVPYPGSGVIWLIEVRTTLGRAYVFKEEFPFEVAAAAGDEKPPAT